MAVEREVVSATVERLRIQGGLTVYEAPALYQELLDSVRRCSRVEVDLSAVDDLDTAGLQVLMICKRESRRLSHELQMLAHSNAVVQAFEFLNLAAFFGDPLVLPATGGV